MKNENIFITSEPLPDPAAADRFAVPSASSGLNYYTSDTNKAKRSEDQLIISFRMLDGYLNWCSDSLKKVKYFDVVYEDNSKKRIHLSSCLNMKFIPLQINNRLITGLSQIDAVYQIKAERVFLFEDE